MDCLLVRHIETETVENLCELYSNLIQALHVIINVPLVGFILLLVAFLDFTVAPLDLVRGESQSSGGSETESKV